MSTSKDTGDWAEQIALAYLKNQGAQLENKNYHCKSGEIDLIMQHKNIRLFVEVRYRSNIYFGNAAETVGHQKQRRIINTANHYLQKVDPEMKLACRFDVISISAKGTDSDINWIQDAFQVS